MRAPGSTEAPGLAVGRIGKHVRVGGLVQRAIPDAPTSSSRSAQILEFLCISTRSFGARARRGAPVANSPSPDPATVCDAQDVNDDAARTAAREALLNPETQALRHECLAALIAGLKWAGDVLRVVGTMVGPRPANGDIRDPRLVGIGYVANTSGELLRGTLVAVDDLNPYAASALLRQVVEAEYLAWAFAEDREEAASWLESTHQDRLARWQPRHLRERSGGRFRGIDYARHCERGGHPTPAGCRDLINGPPAVGCAGLVADSLLHGRSTWHYLMDAVDQHDLLLGNDPGTLLPFDGRRAAHNAVQSWWEFDPFKPYILSG